MIRHEGCIALREALESKTLSPRVVLFGHSHGAFGHVFYNDTHFVNAAQEFGFPIVFDMRVVACATTTHDVNVNEKKKNNNKKKTKKKKNKKSKGKLVKQLIFRIMIDCVVTLRLYIYI